MSDAIAFLRRAIEQGQGLSQADLVLKGGRIFDLVERRTHHRATLQFATTALSERWANTAANARST